MVDGRGQAGFAELGGAHLLQRLRAALEQLEHDGPLQQRVGGEVDDAAAARADLADDLVVLDLTPLRWIHYRKDGCGVSVNERREMRGCDALRESPRLSQLHREGPGQRRLSLSKRTAAWIRRSCVGGLHLRDRGCRCREARGFRAQELRADIETDEPLIGIAIFGRIWRDPVKLANERGFDLSKADCSVQRGDISVVVGEKGSGLPVDAELRATIRAKA